MTRRKRTAECRRRTAISGSTIHSAQRHHLLHVCTVLTPTTISDACSKTLSFQTYSNIWEHNPRFQDDEYE
ncbi:hypothetical protein L1887_08692 [Cichorium endivia]|nr:hypothetical protein L1887_08692 [Cichorium endivia]